MLIVDAMGKHRADRVANALRPKREAHSKDTLGKVRRIGVFGGLLGLTKQQAAVAMAPFEDWSLPGRQSRIVS